MRVSFTRIVSNLSCLLVSSLSFGGVAAATPGVSCDLVADATAIASKIRGLKVLRKVPCRVQDRAEVEKYLLDTIKEKIPQERFVNEGVVYKILGIIPKDYQYLEGIVELYTSQLGGYYDPEKEFYAMASWMPSGLQLSIAVHELTHALQDQHFKLDALLDHRVAESDLLAARSALVEGDATAVMIDFTRKQVGQGPLRDEDSVAAILMQNVAGSMISSALQNAPESLQTMLIFPYISGLRFAHALLREGGYPQIDTAFKRMPESTEHILHPEIYLRGERSFIDVPTPGVPPGFPAVSPEALYIDRFGEFFISTFLSKFIPPYEASRAAAGWGGDKIALYRGSGADSYLLVWDLHWDSEAEAKEFFGALLKYYSQRLTQKPRQDGTTQRFTDPDFGSVGLELKESNVRVIVASEKQI